jgi:hypothetical protein
MAIDKLMTQVTISDEGEVLKTKVNVSTLKHGDVVISLSNAYKLYMVYGSPKIVELDEGEVWAVNVNDICVSSVSLITEEEQ